VARSQAVVASSPSDVVTVRGHGERDASTPSAHYCPAVHFGQSHVALPDLARDEGESRIRNAACGSTQYGDPGLGARVYPVTTRPAIP
jgi:hypothetical protein